MQASPIQLPPPLRQSHSAGKIARRCCVAHLIFHGGLRDFDIFQTRLTAVDFTSSVVLWITVVLLTKFCVVRSDDGSGFHQKRGNRQDNTTAILRY